MNGITLTPAFEQGATLHRLDGLLQGTVRRARHAWASYRTRRQQVIEYKKVAAVRALANTYQTAQPGLAADLRAAVLRWEQESGQDRAA